jgi:hypothetical protein
MACGYALLPALSSTTCAPFAYYCQQTFASCTMTCLACDLQLIWHVRGEISALIYN